MTPETDNAIRAACRRCTEEIQQAMRKKPKAVPHEGTNHQVAKAAFFIAGIHLQPN